MQMRDCALFKYIFGTEIGNILTEIYGGVTIIPPVNSYKGDKCYKGEGGAPQHSSCTLPRPQRVFPNSNFDLYL